MLRVFIPWMGLVAAGTLVLHAETPPATNAPPAVPLTVQLVPSGKYPSDPEEGAKQRTYEAMNLMLNGNLDGAMADLNDAIKINPDAIMAYVARAEIHARKKEWDAAEQDMNTVQKLRPDNPMVQLAGADMEFRQGNFNEARLRYKGISAGPANTELINYRLFLCDVGEKNNSAGEKDLALITNKDGAAYNFAHLAWALYQARPDEAHDFLKKIGQLKLQREVSAVYLRSLDWLGYLPQIKSISEQIAAGK